MVLRYMAAAMMAVAAAPLAKPTLLPLGEYDVYKIKETGCAFSFERKDGKSMFYSLGNTLIVRTKAGLSQCRIPSRAFDTFQSANGVVTCGGQRLSLKKIGKQIDPREGTEDDGSSYPATLSIGTGPAATMVRGNASTAC